MQLLFISLLLFPDHAKAFITNFALNLRFPVAHDPENGARRLLVDISSPTTYVLDRAAFGSVAGILKTLNVSESATFKELSGFNTTYDFPYNQNTTKVSGILGTDQLSLPYGSFNGPFAVVNETQGTEALKNVNGDWETGRLGLARGNDKNNLRSRIFKRFKKKNLCLSVSSYGDAKFISVSLGSLDYKNESLITQISAVETNQDLWKIPVSSWQIGKVKSAVQTNAVISTTIDSIVVPRTVLPKVLIALKAGWNSTLGRYYVDCNNDVSLKIGINNATIDVVFSAYTKEVDGKCILNILGHGTEFVFGAPFFTNNGVCLDYQNDEVHLYHAPTYQYLNGMLKHEITLSEDRFEYVRQE